MCTGQYIVKTHHCEELIGFYRREYALELHCIERYEGKYKSPISLYTRRCSTVMCPYLVDVML
jgi:hypothetical protein